MSEPVATEPLAALQRAFADAITDATAASHPLLADEIVPGGTLGFEQAIDVHRAGYFARLTEQLGETYEAVWWALGDELFFETCRAFIRAHRSRSYNLSDYGAELPAFLRSSALAAEYPFLAELARFEWRFKELFHAEEHPHLDARELPAAATLDGARMEIGRACFLFASDVSVHELWKLRKSPPAAAPAIEWQRPARLLVYKLAGQIRWIALAPAAFAILELLRAGTALADALEATGELYPELTSADVTTLFRDLAASGVVTRLVAAGESAG